MASEEASVYLASQGVLPAYASDTVKAAFAEAAGASGAPTLLDTTIKLETPSVPGYSEIQTAYNEEKKLFLTGQETLDELMQNVTDRRQEVLDANK